VRGRPTSSARAGCFRLFTPCSRIPPRQRSRQAFQIDGKMAVVLQTSCHQCTVSFLMRRALLRSRRYETLDQCTPLTVTQFNRKKCTTEAKLLPACTLTHSLQSLFHSCEGTSSSNESTTTQRPRKKPELLFDYGHPNQVSAERTARRSNRKCL
jgi:hypothetical protein